LTEIILLRLSQVDLILKGETFDVGPASLKWEDNIKIGDVSGSHGGEYEVDSLMGCCAV
jgi:hypothetical protein